MISNVKHASLIQKGLDRVANDLRSHIIKQQVDSEMLTVELQGMLGAIGKGYVIESLSLSIGSTSFRVVMATNAGVYITNVGHPMLTVAEEGTIDPSKRANYSERKVKLDLDSQISEMERRTAIFKLAGEPDNIILNMGKGKYYLYYCRRGVSGKMMGIDEVVTYVMDKESTTSVIPFDMITKAGK